MNFGCQPSVLDGTEQKYEVSESLDLPEEYSYRNYLSPVIDQGETSTCVPSSISAHLNWNINVDTDGNNTRDNHINIQDIYSARGYEGDHGMQFKQALHYLLKTGCRSDVGRVKIKQYALVPSILALKQALVSNGPCVCGMMVYNMGPYFWDKNTYEGDFGGHATAIVGYDRDGFIIRNSWGTHWANKGYIHITYKDFQKYNFECWTIID